METKPTHEQAQLHLQVYDLRREARLRQARDWFQQNYHADTLEEAMTLVEEAKEPRPPVAPSIPSPRSSVEIAAESPVGSVKSAVNTCIGSKNVLVPESS